MRVTCYHIPIINKKGAGIMLGIEDPYILLAYVLSFVSALGCVIYGILNWNKEED